MADDMGFPPMPEGKKKQNSGLTFNGFPSKSANPLKTGSLAYKPPVIIPLSLQKNLKISGVNSTAQKQELKKESVLYRKILEKESKEWKKAVSEKKNEIRILRDALNRKEYPLDDKIIEMKNELKSKIRRERARLGEEKKSLEKKNAELKAKLNIVEAGWKKKEQEVKVFQEKTLKVLKKAENKFQEEREKTWFKTLKVKEEEINALKVEIALQESRTRAMLEKKQEEGKALEEKAGKALKAIIEEIGREKENILEKLSRREKEINDLKESFAGKEKYLTGKVEDAELDGKLSLAKFEQEFKAREVKLWAEREDWITVLKNRFKEKESMLQRQLAFEMEKRVLAGAEKLRDNDGLWEEKMILKEMELKTEKNEMAKVIAELKTLKEQGPGERSGTLTEDKDAVIRNLNEAIVKIEKEKAAIKDLVLEKSEAEEIKNKEIKDLMETVSVLTEDKNKYEFKTRKVTEELARAVSDAVSAQNESSGLRAEVENLKLFYEERLRQVSINLESRETELNKIKEGINANLSKLEEQNKYMEELRNAAAEAAANYNMAKNESAAASELLKSREVENQKLQVELGGLVTRSEELSKLAEEKELRLNNATFEFNGKIEALTEALKLKEKEIETAKIKVQELEHRIGHDYEIKEEELKLAINRLQMQVKETVTRYETELKTEKQKIQSLQAEYALREVQWNSQKNKDRETRGQMADMEASYAKLKNDSSGNIYSLKRELVSFETKLKESAEKIFKLEEERGSFVFRIKNEAVEKDKSLETLNNSLKKLRRRFKFILWLWYPNEPRE